MPNWLPLLRRSSRSTCVCASRASLESMSNWRRDSQVKWPMPASPAMSSRMRAGSFATPETTIWLGSTPAAWQMRTSPVEQASSLSTSFEMGPTTNGFAFMAKQMLVRGGRTSRMRLTWSASSRSSKT